MAERMSSWRATRRAPAATTPATAAMPRIVASGATGAEKVRIPSCAAIASIRPPPRNVPSRARRSCRTRRRDGSHDARAQLPAGLADGAHQAELAGAFVDRQRPRVGDAPQAISTANPSSPYTTASICRPRRRRYAMYLSLVWARGREPGRPRPRRRSGRLRCRPHRRDRSGPRRRSFARRVGSSRPASHHVADDLARGRRRRPRRLAGAVGVVEREGAPDGEVVVGAEKSLTAICPVCMSRRRRSTRRDRTPTRGGRGRRRWGRRRCLRR